MSKNEKNEVFRCPYCGKTKDRIELNYNSEFGGFQPTVEKLGDIRDVYDYKHSNYQYTRYDVPICDDCLIIHQEASSKATIVALCLFVPIAFYLLTQYHGFWEFLIPVGLVGFVCLIIRWLIKVFLINRQGIKYHAHNSGSYISIENAPVYDMLKSTEEIQQNSLMNRLDKELEESSKRFADWKRHHETIEVDVGIGRKQYITRYISDKELYERNREKEPSEYDYSKIGSINEEAHENYDDDDFEGTFV